MKSRNLLPLMLCLGMCTSMVHAGFLGNMKAKAKNAMAAATGSLGIDDASKVLKMPFAELGAALDEAKKASNDKQTEFMTHMNDQLVERPDAKTIFENYMNVVKTAMNEMKTAHMKGTTEQPSTSERLITTLKEKLGVNFPTGGELRIQLAFLKLHYDIVAELIATEKTALEKIVATDDFIKAQGRYDQKVQELEKALTNAFTKDQVGSGVKTTEVAEITRVAITEIPTFKDYYAERLKEWKAFVAQKNNDFSALWDKALTKIPKAQQKSMRATYDKLANSLLKGGMMGEAKPFKEWKSATEKLVKDLNKKIGTETKKGAVMSDATKLEFEAAMTAADTRFDAAKEGVEGQLKPARMPIEGMVQ